MESKTYYSFLEIRSSIVSNSNYLNSNNKVKGYVLNHIQLILTYVCEPRWNLNLKRSMTNNIAESANSEIKRWITTRTSPKVLYKQLKNIVKLQFIELKKSFYKGEGAFVIPEHVFSRNSLNESDLNKMYFKFLNAELEYHPVINLQVKKDKKKKLN